MQQAVGSGSDLLGPAVTVAHRLLKNTIRARIGSRPYLFMTDAAATALGTADVGVSHRETYEDAGDETSRSRRGVGRVDARPRLGLAADRRAVVRGDPGVGDRRALSTPPDDRPSDDRHDHADEPDERDTEEGEGEQPDPPVVAGRAGF